MLYNFLENLPRCSDASANFLGLFDTTVAPPLLFYSYIPILIISIGFGLLMLLNNKTSHLNRLFFGITSSFVIWILLILVQWTAIHVNLVHFAWQALIIFELLIYVLSISLIYIFIYKKELPDYVKNLFLILISLVSIIVPTKLNVSYFDLTHCEGVVGNLWNYQYVFEVLSIMMILFLVVDGKRKNKYKFLSAEVLIGLGISFFLAIFSSSNILGEITKTYDINLVGPIGMLALLILLSYTIVKFQTFNIKLIGSQALVFVLWFFTFSLLFVGTIENARIVVVINLFLFSIIGFYLIRGVKREVEQRERIENLAKELGEANVKLRELDQMKSEFLSLATHQIRAPLTAIKGYSSMLLEGDFGVLPQKARDSVQIIMKSCQNLINVVGDFLNISRIEQGRMVYEKTNFDISKLVKEVANELIPNVSNAGLTLEVEVAEGTSGEINADKDKIKQVIGNLIDNAIKYTVHGGIKILISSDDSKVKVAIKDTGVGIDPKEMDKLFSKFSRTKDANKTNVIGTGLGLYIAKKMTEAHHGNIKVESDGVGKGSTFTIELPRIK